MKSGAAIWAKVANAKSAAKAVVKLKDAHLRSLLTWLLKNVPAGDANNEPLLGLALVESAERFRRGQGKISKRRIL